MNYSIYIRPLLTSDTERTFLWSNDPELWKFSKARWNACSDKDMEFNWIRFLLEKTTDRYFAICLNLSDQHIGNVQLTNITAQTARCCVIIGEKLLWGRGLATRAIMLISDYAFNYKKLEQLFVEIHRQNIAAMIAYKKCGFVKYGENRDDYSLFKLNSKCYFNLIGDGPQ